MYIECDDGDVRLVGGTSIVFGRVEICIDRKWGKVCADSHWDDFAAAVVCWQVGLSAQCKCILKYMVGQPHTKW